MKIILILLISFFLTGCEEKVHEDNTNNYFSVVKDTIEVYDDVYMDDILSKNSDDNIEIITDNYKLNTDKIGTKEYSLYYYLDKKKYVYKFSINIVDTEEPRVLSGTNKTIVKNYKGDLCDLIMYGDNYTGNVSCVIEGDYDLSKIGTYNITYNLSDSSNNLKKVNVTLNVVEKINNSSSPNTSKTYFSEIVENYKNDNNEIGIDVSKWQGDIDFEKVKEAGATFVMMRIGAQASKDGELYIDSYFLKNIEMAKAAGLKVGVYLYSMAGSIKEAKSQAEWVVQILNKENLELPIAFDWENWSKWNSFKISFHEINVMADTFIETVQKYGYDGILYSSKNYLEKIWNNKNDYPVWLAHYTSNTNYTGKYKIWQLCNNGRIDGINGDVDINIMYK